MNRLKLLATATLMALTFTACDEGTPPPVEPPPAPTPVGTISGAVTIEGTAASGITATLSSGATTTTGSGGNFAFSGVEAGTYTVTISGFPEDATFAQVTQSATIATDGQNVQLNFAGEYIRSSAVVGNVVAADAMMSGGDGQPETLAGVTVTLDGEHAMGETMETGMDGGFAFTGLRAGTYTVTISDYPEDVSFETVSVEVEVEVGDVGQADFTGHFIRTSAVEGEVIIDGEGLQGVTVTLAGGPADENHTMMTDADGMYRFDDLRPGDYTVSISDFDTRDYEFAATSQDVSVDLDETGTVSFTGVLLRTSGIAGRVSVEGMGLGDITVTLSGAADASTTTDAGGQYAFAGLAAGDYTVTIAVESAAYVFDAMSMDRTVGDDESAIVNFEGQHARTASVAGQLFIDELDNNDMMDAGENSLEAAGVPVALVGPGVNDQRLSATGPDGSFGFSGLRAGSYQLVVPIDATAAAALAASDVAYGGPGTGYSFDLGVGETKMQGIPFDITHTTVTFSVSLRSGDEMGDALPGASVSLYGANSAMVGSGMTGDDGSVAIKVDRSMTSGNMVNARVDHDDYDAADDMTAVTWNPQEFATSGSNSNDIVNLKVDVNISGRTVERTGQPDSGQPLAGWTIDVMMGDAAVAGAPTALGDDGSVAFTTTVESVPASFSFTVAEDQEDELDGGEMYDASGGGYTHDGLSLAGDPVDADAIVVTFTTQTLKVYVHHERDQVYGFTGSSLDGDSRIGGVVDIQVRHRGANGRPQLFTTAQWDRENNTVIGRGSRAGTYTYTNLPADANVFVTADAADGYMLLDPRALDAYGDEDGLMGGAFGDDGGWGHTVSICPLQAVDPTGQDHDACGSFAVVTTYGVTANVSKRRVRKSGVGFRSSDLPNGSVTHHSELTVDLTPVEGKNLGGNARSRTTAEIDDQTQPGDERRELDFGTMAAGTYALGLPEGWRATDEAGGRGQNAFAPLDGNVALTVEPSTAILYGFVRNARQEGLEGVTVHVNGTEAVTDEWGRYIASGIPSVRGQIFVHTSRPGFPDTRPDSTNNPNTEVPGFAANSVNPWDIALSGANNTFTVTGMVREVNTGAPISGARILAGGSNPLNGRTTGRGDWLGQVRTGSDGSYTAIVAATGVGQFVNMTASASGYTFLPAEGIPVHAQAGTSHSVDFTGHSRGKVVGRVVAPDGTPASGITVTAYEGTNSSGDELDDMTTSSTGTFSLAVGAYGSFFIEAEIACVNSPVTEAEIDLCRQEAFSWFDYPGGQMGTVISAGQPVQFGDIQMRSVQPRITGVQRLTHATIALSPTVTAPGDYREYVEVSWEYDREDHQPASPGATPASDAVTTGGIALAGVNPAPATALDIGILDQAGTTFTAGVPTAALAAHAGTGTETVEVVSIIQIPSGSPTAYLAFSGEIELTITGRTFQNPWTAAGTTENPSASFNVAAVNTTASGVTVTSRTATSIGLRWMGTGSPVLQHRIALMIEGQWLLVPDGAVTTAVVRRITTGANRGQWDLTNALALAPATGTSGWTNLTGTSRRDVTAAQLAGPLQVMILTGQGTDAATATGWMSSTAVSVSGG
jgi:hypothetical protein